MIEILSILTHLLIITIFCYPSKYLINFFNNNKNIDFIERLELGIVINIFLLLIISFFLRKNSNIVFYFVSIFFLINLYSFIRDYFESTKLKKLILNKEFFILFLLAFILSVALSSHLKIGWDAQNYWLVKKLIFTNNGDIFDLKFSPRDDYPYLGSFLWFFYSKVSFLNYEYFGRIFYIYLFLISIFSVNKIFTLSFFEYFFLNIVVIFLVYNIQLFSGYQEILIFSLLILLTKNYFYIYSSEKLSDKFNGNFYLISIIAFSLIWIKNETAVLIVISVSSFLFSCHSKINLKLKLFFATFALFAIKYFLFKYIGLSTHIQKGNYETLQFSELINFINLERFFLIGKYLFFGAFETIIYLAIIPILIIFSIKQNNKSFFRFLLFCFIFSFLFLIAAFLLTTFPLEWHLKTALNRLMFETCGFFIILFPIFYSTFLKKKFFH
jgi:hypothetical protein